MIQQQHRLTPHEVVDLILAASGYDEMSPSERKEFRAEVKRMEREFEEWQVNQLGKEAARDAENRLNRACHKVNEAYADAFRRRNNLYTEYVRGVPVRTHRGGN
jgi:hypothetical protein